MRQAIEKISEICSLKVGMQKKTFKKNGKKLIKEKAFHIVFETERDVIQNLKRPLKESEIPSENDEIQAEFNQRYREVFKKTRKSLLRQ